MIIIPARLNSTRFSNKVLVDVLGMPMCVRTALNAKSIDDVVVASDAQEVVDICKSHGVDAMLTPEFSCGSDRVAYATKQLGLAPHEIVINLQADEPFIETHILDELKNLMHKSSFMATLATPLPLGEDSINAVKVVLGEGDRAIYFSRALIPFNRDAALHSTKNTTPYYKHLGIYAFSAASIREYVDLSATQLEGIESLEQLRALYYNKEILVKIVESKSIGIDTVEDLQNALRRFG